MSFSLGIMSSYFELQLNYGDTFGWGEIMETHKIMDTITVLWIHGPPVNVAKYNIKLHKMREIEIKTRNFDSHFVLKGNKKCQQHPEFPSGLPSKYYPGPILLNFSDRTRTGVFNMVWPLTRDNANIYLDKDSERTITADVMTKYQDNRINYIRATQPRS